MALLNRSAVLGAVDVKTKDIDVPEWGGAVRVRTMTLAERKEFARRAGEDEGSVGAWLVAKLVVDEAGGAMFKEEDIAALEGRNWHAMQAVVAAILDVNGMSEKAADEAIKN